MEDNDITNFKWRYAIQAQPYVLVQQPDSSTEME